MVGRAGGGRVIFAPNFVVGACPGPHLPLSQVAARQSNMEPGARPMAYHCVCEESHRAGDRARRQKVAGRYKTVPPKPGRGKGRPLENPRTEIVEPRPSGMISHFTDILSSMVSPSSLFSTPAR